jgi:hypothetical protein
MWSNFNLSIGATTQSNSFKPMDALEPLLVQFDAVGNFILDAVDAKGTARAWSEVSCGRGRGREISIFPIFSPLATFTLILTSYFNSGLSLERV